MPFELPERHLHLTKRNYPTKALEYRKYRKEVHNQWQGLATGTKRRKGNYMK
jgi:hypothetical protein